jgi:3-hydroxyisobutyrate dehydrogenase-like beta-hydroxyacid dehydrogenase
MSNKIELGFVGVGRMGGPMSERLLAAGHSLTVFDTVPANVEARVKKGAKKASSAAEVASRCGHRSDENTDAGYCSQRRARRERRCERQSVRTLIDLSTTGPGVSNIVEGADPAQHRLGRFTRERRRQA